MAPRGGRNDHFKPKKHFFTIKNVENNNESNWETAESCGGLIWGSKVLRGNLSPPGVAPRNVKNHTLTLKSIFFESKVGIQAAGWIYSHMLEISYAYGAQEASRGT